ncbi:MAG: hypothetical protein ACKO2N_11030 [Tabrizicola sp.]
MTDLSSISFEVIDLEPGGPKTMHPRVNETLFAELVRSFEASAAYDPAGGYAGIVPSYFNYGDLRDYWLGAHPDESNWSSSGSQYLLGCECGEAGCWPLDGHIEVQGEEVVWSQFSQPHRRERDYAGFGPFRFSLVAYTRALDAALTALTATENET